MHNGSSDKYTTFIHHTAVNIFMDICSSEYTNLRVRYSRVHLSSDYFYRTYTTFIHHTSQYHIYINSLLCSLGYTKNETKEEETTSPSPKHCRLKIKSLKHQIYC